MDMPIGKYKGQPLASMKAAYLAWILSQDHIRHKHWSLAEGILAELRRRMDDDNEALRAELYVPEKPPSRKPTPEQIEKKEAERAEKLRALEKRRQEEKERRIAEHRRRMALARAERGQILNAAHFRRAPNTPAYDLV